MQMKVFMWEEEGGAMGHGIGEKCRKADRFAIVRAHVALQYTVRLNGVCVFIGLNPETQSLHNELKTEGEIVMCKQN